MKATYLWLNEGTIFLEEVAIRQSLNDSLLRYGGNIGYGVRFPGGTRESARKYWLVL